MEGISLACRACFGCSADAKRHTNNHHGYHSHTRSAIASHRGRRWIFQGIARLIRHWDLHSQHQGKANRAHCLHLQYKCYIVRKTLLPYPITQATFYKLAPAVQRSLRHFMFAIKHSLAQSEKLRGDSKAKSVWMLRVIFASILNRRISCFRSCMLPLGKHRLVEVHDAAIQVFVSLVNCATHFIWARNVKSSNAS